MGRRTEAIARLSAYNLKKDEQKCAKVHLNAGNTRLPVFKAWLPVRRDSNNRICPHLTEFDNWLLYLVILAEEFRCSSQTLAVSLQTGILNVTNNVRREFKLPGYGTRTASSRMLWPSNCCRATNLRHYTHKPTKPRVMINWFIAPFISNSVLKRGLEPFEVHAVIYGSQSLTYTNPTFCPHSVFMFFVWISEQTAIISLYSINWLVFE